jgi:hypothetical protein
MSPHGWPHPRAKTRCFFCKVRVCMACVERKMHETRHESKTTISSARCLQLLHMDLIGPPSHDRLGEKKYCLAIVDDSVPTQCHGLNDK